MAPMASGAGTSRHRAICTFSACAMLSLVQPAWPGDGGGEGAERAIEKLEQSAPPNTAAKPAAGAAEAVKEISLRQFGNLGKRELSRIRTEMITEGKNYKIEGFSEEVTLMLVTYARDNPRSARSLMEEMQRWTTRAERIAYLQQELSRVNGEIEALTRSVKKLDRDTSALGQKIGGLITESSEQKAQYDATVRLRAEEETRLNAAEHRKTLLLLWRGNPDEGLLPK